MKYAKWLLTAFLCFLLYLWWSTSPELPEAEQRVLDESCLAFGDTVVRDIVSTWDVDRLPSWPTKRGKWDVPVLWDARTVSTGIFEHAFNAALATTVISSTGTTTLRSAGL